MPQIVLLGPQQPLPNILSVVRSLEIEGPFAAVTAGWQEREAEVEELDAHLGKQTVNLRLHLRLEEIFERDPELRDGHRRNQEILKRLQEVYRVRLNHGMNAVWALVERRGSLAGEILDPEIEHAIQAVRTLDRHHLDRILARGRSFQEQWNPENRPEVMSHRYEIAEILKGCKTVLIAGGHVAVLLNRLRLLNLAPLFQGKTVIAWSGGTMVLGREIVLFHDTPPQGRGYAEVFETGLGLFTGVIPLPHARKRLLLDDANRVSIFARRFADGGCATLDSGAHLDFDGRTWRAGEGVGRLFADGRVAAWEAV